jgi:hypothetical protein
VSEAWARNKNGAMVCDLLLKFSYQSLMQKMLSTGMKDLADLRRYSKTFKIVKNKMVIKYEIF